MILLDTVILATLTLTNNDIITSGTEFHLTLTPNYKIDQLSVHLSK